MSLLLSLCLLWLMPLALMLGDDPHLDCKPRKTVPYHRDNGKLFREEGVWDYSTMVLREDLGLLILGAREAIYALDLSNISKKNASVKWAVTQSKQDECKSKGKDPETECKNYIRVLHTMDDGRMYVCGTNAFDPECDFMSYTDGRLTLENKQEDGKGKCPFGPSQSYTSTMTGDDLYSATSMNFLGSEPVVMRSSSVTIRTEFKSSWLNEPNFISMAQMPESENSGEGDDDKVYLFFSESAVEYDFYTKLVVSRVARVCKGDLGGQRTLQKKWTSFLKATVDCPVFESQLPFNIQDTYLLCDPQKHWSTCLFYALFTPQIDSSDLSAVCAYSVSDISAVFSKGKYKSPVPVETSFVKWVMYSGDVPSPRPGACIDNEARKRGINQTLDLPDTTLQFIKDRPLMDQAVLPVKQRPLLVRRGAAFSRIIVNQVVAGDGRTYNVMFIGTEEGSLVKAVDYDGEMFIIEEVQLFPSPEPIKVLKFSDVTGQLFAGSRYGAVQAPLATCERALSCMDCVLARDPYCGWNKSTAKCVALSNVQRDLIQSVKQGDASLCPANDPVKPVNQSIQLGGNLKLWCPPPSNLAEISWQRDTLPLPLSDHRQVLPDGLLIFNASASDAGLYSCRSLEHSHSAIVADYQVRLALGEKGLPILQARRGGSSVVRLQAAVGLLAVLLAALLSWNFYKGHLPLPCKRKDKTVKGDPDHCGYRSAQIHREAQSHVLEGNCSGEYKHTDEAEVSTRNGENASLNVDFPPLQYIDNESEI